MPLNVSAWRTWGSELQTRTFCLERSAVVHTCSPNNPHILSAEALIRAGIHVVLEKPVDTTVIFQVSAGRKNRLWLEINGTTGSVVFGRENPETIWLGWETSQSCFTAVKQVRTRINPGSTTFRLVTHRGRPTPLPILSTTPIRPSVDTYPTGCPSSRLACTLSDSPTRFLTCQQ